MSFVEGHRQEAGIVEGRGAGGFGDSAIEGAWEWHSRRIREAGGEGRRADRRANTEW
jgi:hypothetical protein